MTASPEPDAEPDRQCRHSSESSAATSPTSQNCRRESGRLDSDLGGEDLGWRAVTHPPAGLSSRAVDFYFPGPPSAIDALAHADDSESDRQRRPDPGSALVTCDQHRRPANIRNRTSQLTARTVLSQ